MLYTAGKSLVGCSIDNKTWKPQWKIACRKRVLRETGTPGLVGLYEAGRPTAWVAAFDNGIVPLGQQLEPFVGLTWLAKGRTFIQEEAGRGPVHEIVGGSDTVSAAEASQRSKALTEKTIAALPDLGRAKKKGPSKKGDSKKAQKFSELPPLSRALCRRIDLLNRPRKAPPPSPDPR